MSLSITERDLTILDEEPRVQDLRLAEALGFSQPRDIRKLIDRNKGELELYGLLARHGGAPIRSGKGRLMESLEYWLNEAQALLVCMFSRTDQAARVRRELVEVFMAWRRGKALGGAGAGSAALFPLDEQPLGLLWAKIALLKEVRLGHGSRAAAQLYATLGLPPVTGSQIAEADEGRACLAALLAASAEPGNPASAFTLASELAAALDGDEDLAEQIQPLGLRVVSEAGRRGVLVANGRPFLTALFAQTAWRKGAWSRALRRLPGASPAGPQRYGPETQRGTFIPEAVLDEVAAGL